MQALSILSLLLGMQPNPERVHIEGTTSEISLKAQSLIEDLIKGDQEGEACEGCVIRTALFVIVQQLAKLHDAGYPDLAFAEAEGAANKLERIFQLMARGDTPQNILTIMNEGDAKRLLT